MPFSFSSERVCDPGEIFFFSSFPADLGPYFQTPTRFTRLFSGFFAISHFFSSSRFFYRFDVNFSFSASSFLAIPSDIDFIFFRELVTICSPFLSPL